MFDLFHLTHKHSGGDGALIDHGDLLGLADDDHTQYHNDSRGDARYAPIAQGVTNGNSHDHAGGDGAQIDHGGLAGLADDDHSQYHNDARGDARYAPIGRTYFVPLATGLTSTSWDGDARSTTAKTLIDLSAVFGVPAGVKAVYVAVSCRDSASASTNNLFVLLSPNNTAGSGQIINRISGQVNDYWQDVNAICCCDPNGDIYYQIAASGAGTMDIYLTILGYWI